MAGHATLAQRLVFKDEGPALRRVALDAGVVVAQQSRAATLKRLGTVRSAPFDRVSLMRVVTIRAAHFPFQHWVVMREFEFCPHFQVALETSFGRFARVHDGVEAAAALDVKTARPVARFTTHVLGVLSGGLEAGVSRGRKVARDLLVTLRALT